MDGLIIVDKPEGWTSHDAVNKLRRLASTKKVGHLGTLDPMATGVLPLVIGRATRLAQFFTKSAKLYEGTIRFGHSTDTYDREGKATSPETGPDLNRERLDVLFDRFRGLIQQTPPPVSAKKVGGTPAYKLARKQIQVELKAVGVTVHSLELLDFHEREAKVRIHCSAGTYVRAIAHEVGQLAGCGAFLQSLRRLASGSFDISQAHTIGELEALSEDGRLGEVVIPGAKLLPEFPAEPVDAVTVGQIRQGRDFRVSPFRVRAGTRYVKALSPEGELVAIGEAKLPNLYHPILVL
ncbi:MAG: tRNA pseudouridine(55) synthase TruB [Bryobacteraceae bacterium]